MHISYIMHSHFDRAVSHYYKVHNAEKVTLIQPTICSSSEHLQKHTQSFKSISINYRNCADNVLLIYTCLSVTSHIHCIVGRCLKNVVYVSARVLIRPC